MEYKFYGSDGLFNYSFIEDEVVELENIDWDFLNLKLGLKINDCCKFCKLMVMFMCGVFVYMNWI